MYTVSVYNIILLDPDFPDEIQQDRSPRNATNWKSVGVELGKMPLFKRDMIKGNTIPFRLDVNCEEFPMRLRIAALAALLVLVNGALGAEEAALLSKFEGDWHSDGAAFGKPALSRMTWKMALDNRFYRLDYTISIQNEPDAPRVFQGVAYYQISDRDGLLAFWADNSGDLHPIVAARERDALVANWGVEGGKQGRTRYELLSADRMEVTDWIMTPDGWRQFNRNIFSRSVNGQPG